MLCLLLLLLACGGARADDDAKPARLQPLPQKLDVMVCIDASTTMEGLRDGFAEGLWRLTVDFYRELPDMDFRIGLLRYGSEGERPRDREQPEGQPQAEAAPADLSQEPQLLKNLTLNFDAISEQLGQITIFGGREYVAAALETALTSANWTTGATRMLIIAGNESPHQDPERDTLALCRRARGRGISVHALYCGGENDLHAGAWEELAKAGGGRFDTYDLEIPQREPRIPTPFDRKLADLSGRLTATYLCGAGQSASLQRLRRADQAAAKRSLAVSADRAVARALRPVDPGADLVARHAAGTPLQPKEVPPTLEKLDRHARTAALAARAETRKALRARIRAIGQQRQRWYRTHRRRGARRLDAVLHGLVVGPRPIPR